MPREQDIEIRVEQLAEQINADPEAFGLLLQGIARSMYADKPQYKPLVDALLAVGASSDIVAEYAE